MSEPDIMIRACGLHAGYGTGRTYLPAIEDISFDLEKGHRLAVIGPNGCGKTTLLRVLSGAIAWKGSLWIAGSDRSRMKARRAALDTALLSQLSTSYFPYTVRQTVEMGRYAAITASKRQSPRDGKQSIDRLLASCGIEDLAERQLPTLSGGQLQRVFLARTLAQEPRVLLLDEPTNHLDFQYQTSLLALVRSTGLTTVAVFHDLALAFDFADSILLMEAGRLVCRGTAQELAQSDELNRVYGMDVAARMRNLLQNW